VVRISERTDVCADVGQRALARAWMSLRTAALKVEHADSICEGGVAPVHLLISVVNAPVA